MRDLAATNKETCIGKIPYDSMGEARTAAQGLSGRVGARNAQGLTGYRCSACDKFHVGHDRNRGRGRTQIKRRKGY